MRLNLAQNLSGICQKHAKMEPERGQGSTKAAPLEKYQKSTKRGRQRDGFLGAAFASNPCKNHPQNNLEINCEHILRLCKKASKTEQNSMT